MNVTTKIWSIAERAPDRVAVRSARGSITFGELRARARRVAGAVASAGLRPGDRVVFIAPSVVEFPVVYYGLHAAGVGVITMNTMSTAAEIGYVLDDAEVALVIAWHEAETAASVAAAERGIPFWRIEDGAALDAEPSPDVHEHEPDDTALILYTSGTTGRPKGVELTVANLVAVSEMLPGVLLLTPEDRFGTALPLFHVFGQVMVMNTMLSNGIPLSLLSPFEPIQMLEMISRDRLTGVSGVPTMWNAMLNASTELVADDFRSLRLATSGGASLPAEVLRAFKERFGCTILEGYGLTESTGAATTTGVSRPQKPGKVGTALPGIGIEIRGADGRAVGPGTVGEIHLAGPTIMKGYRNRPEATAADLRQGWLRTGDLGVLDEEGYLSIVDRVKDLIIRGGYNVYPREVEDVLYQHADVVEAAVVGVPDDRLGEEVVAVVALRPGASLSGDDLRAWAKIQLSAYKVPRFYRFVASLPKSPTGKILKRELDVAGIRDLATG